MKGELKKRQISVAEARAMLWRKGVLAHLLHSGQRSIYDQIKGLNEATREVCLRISRRYGKTFLGLVMATEHCLQHSGSTVIILAPTQGQAVKIIGEVFSHVLAEKPADIVIENKVSRREYKFANGSKIIFGGFDTAAERLRGLAANLLIIEEAGATRPETYSYVYSSVLMPMLLNTNGKIINIYTPPLEPAHPLITQIEPKTAAHGAFFTFNIYDCPLYTTNQIEQIKDAVGGESSRSWQVEFLCKIIRDESVVAIPEFCQQKHTVNILPDLGPTSYWVAGDVGGVRDYSCFLLLATNAYNKATYVVAEAVCQPNSTHSQLYSAINNLASKYRPQLYIIDAPGQTRVELDQEYGLPITFPQKPKNNFYAANIEIREALNNGQLIIHQNCSFLIKTLEIATLNATKTDYERQPEIGHADALAALIYGYRHKLMPQLPPPKNEQEVGARMLDDWLLKIQIQKQQDEENLNW